MIGLLCFVLAVLASPFKSKLRLEAENAVLRHQLIVLRRSLHGRVRLTNQSATITMSPIALNVGSILFSCKVIGPKRYIFDAQFDFGASDHLPLVCRVLRHGQIIGITLNRR
jgi:hypothetical protein